MSTVHSLHGARLTVNVRLRAGVAAALASEAYDRRIPHSRLAEKLLADQLPQLAAELLDSQNTATPEVPAPGVAQLTTRDVKHNR